ncbi:MAG TPA: helix-turn-helix domain-containing protein [Mesotoga infera]|nr:TetR/AcrR family transcriptional regulator [Thermotogaceae bacterium]HPD38673.1 helix-turn-helix domain-containing protein [Mesotoga infera]HRR44720.1 helix-turn-helix domain-containing protein [Mesotoga sp.]HRV02058.1 helix-turn-helix domain-containing protein [Mesotoga sp.]
MTTEEINTRERIFKATLELIKEGKDANRLTTRQIGDRAGVNPSLVNYHFQSKENLIGQVVGTMMGEIIGQLRRSDAIENDPETRLREILLTTADAAFKFYNVSRIAIAGELKEGCRNSCQMVLPLLQEIFKGYTLPDLNVIALQLMLPFHHIVVDPDLYGKYLGADFFDEKQRRRKINQMVDLVLARYDKEAKE